ncbi:MAG: class I SAM-dependent methyltransferase [Bacillota bacterium]|nr:class I SAM-dependent methyltransferase [Bacillota bacterium]
MKDNSTAHMALEYDSKVNQTIPRYEFFHTDTIDMVKTAVPNPGSWLDTGCGTGNLISKAYDLFPKTIFILADPSESMLGNARQKLGFCSERLKILEPAGSQDLSLDSGSLDVITAIQSHHYFDAETRKKATLNCFRMLGNGGIYITFENIRPFSEDGTKVGLKRWANYQVASGKSAEEAEKHVERFGTEFFPITISEHLDLLRNAGFKTVEILYASYMQAGFYAIK